MNGEKRIFQARSDDLQPALAFVEAFCERQGIGAPDMLRLTLIVEELFTNTLLHGHRGDAESPVHIELGAGATHLLLAYEDHAPPFDPLQYLASMPPREVEAVEAMVPGGQGLPLVAQMSERFDYEHIEGRNSARLSIRRQT